MRASTFAARGFVAGFFGAIALAMPAIADPYGDGSATSNPDLLRSGYANKCLNAWDCPVGKADRAPAPVYKGAQPADVTYRQPDAVVVPASCAPVSPDAPYELTCDEPSLTVHPGVGVQVAAEVYVPDAEPSLYLAPPEPVDSWLLDPEWSIGLRGAYGLSSSGPVLGVYVVPSVNLTREKTGGLFAIRGSATIGLDSYGLRIPNATGSIEASRQLGRSTTAQGQVTLDLSQDEPDAPGTIAGVSQQPLVFTGSALGSFTHTMGRVSVTGGANLTRQMYGTTTMRSGAVVDNSELNRIEGGARLRAGLGVTRSTNLFVEGRVSRNIYDAASSALGVKLDSWTYAILGGAAFDWRGVVSAEFAGGYGMRRFDAATLNSRGGFLGSASVTIRPEQRLSFTGSASTEFSVPATGSTVPVEIDYIASLSALYRVNRRLNLRGSLSGEWRDRGGAAPNGWTLSAGAGADFALTRNLSVSADYTYQTGEDNGTARETSHQVGLGIRLAR